MWPTPYPMTTTQAGWAGTGRRASPLAARAAARTTAAPRLRRARTRRRAGRDHRQGAGPHGRANGRVLRDEATAHSTVIWKGKTAVFYPWGRFDHSERLTYDIDDAHPDTARVRGDSDYDQAAQGHVLTWRGRLELSSDATDVSSISTRGHCCATARWFAQRPGRNRFRGIINKYAASRGADPAKKL